MTKRNNGTSQQADFGIPPMPTMPTMPIVAHAPEPPEPEAQGTPDAPDAMNPDDETFDPDLGELLRPDPPAVGPPGAQSAPRSPAGFLPDLLGGEGAGAVPGRQDARAPSDDGPAPIGDDPLVGGGDEGAGGERMPSGDKMPAGQLQALEEFLGQWPEDFRVEVRVSQAKNGRLISRGLLEDVLISYARVPERYVPYGGTFFFEFFSIGAKRARLGKGGHRITFSGAEPPENWRVEDQMEIDTAKLAAAIVAAQSTASHPTCGSGTGVPNAVWQDNVDELRKQNTALQDEVRKAREEVAAKRAADAVQQAVASALGPLQAELASVKAALGGVGPKKDDGGERYERMLDKVLDSVLRGGGDGNGQRDVDILKIVTDNYQKTQGPDALAAIAGLYNELVDGLKKTIEGMKLGSAGQAAGAVAGATDWSPEKIGGLVSAGAAAIQTINGVLMTRRQQMLNAMGAAGAPAGNTKPAADAAVTAPVDANKAALDKITQEMAEMIAKKESPEAIAAVIYSVTLMARRSDDLQIKAMMNSVKNNPKEAMAALVCSLGGDVPMSVEVGNHLARLMGHKDTMSPATVPVVAVPAAPSGDGKGPDAVQAVPGQPSSGKDVAGGDGGTAPGDGKQGSGPHAVVVKTTTQDVMGPVQPS